MNVIKLGGSLLDDPARRAEALSAIAAQWNRGEEVVLVHGGGKHVDANLKRLGIPKRTYAGLRITDDETLDVVVATLAGSVNKMLVAELAAISIRAAGISGCDASTLVAEVHPPIDGIDLGRLQRRSPSLSAPRSSSSSPTSLVCSMPPATSSPRFARMKPKHFSTRKSSPAACGPSCRPRCTRSDQACVASPSEKREGRS